jgi:hypothetical protein
MARNIRSSPETYEEDGAPAHPSAVGLGDNTAMMPRRAPRVFTPRRRALAGAF